MLHTDRSSTSDGNYSFWWDSQQILSLLQQIFQPPQENRIRKCLGNCKQATAATASIFCAKWSCLFFWSSSWNLYQFKLRQHWLQKPKYRLELPSLLTPNPIQRWHWQFWSGSRLKFLFPLDRQDEFLHVGNFVSRVYNYFRGFPLFSQFSMATCLFVISMSVD